MAELLGIISGIVSIADVGFRIYKALSSIAAALGAAGSEILMFSAEVRIFAEILVVLRTNLRNHTLSRARSHILEQAIDVIPGLLTQCEIVYGRMEDIMGRLETSTDNKFLIAASKLKWLKEKSKLLELRGFLEPLKSSLQLLLSLIKNEIADNQREPSVIRSILREELKLAFQESKSQPESLDEDTGVEDLALIPVEHAVVLRTRPLHTIKEAAQAMIAKYEASPEPTDENQDSEYYDMPEDYEDAYAFQAQSATDAIGSMEKAARQLEQESHVAANSHSVGNPEFEPWTEEENLHNDTLLLTQGPNFPPRVSASPDWAQSGPRRTPRPPQPFSLDNAASHPRVGLGFGNFSPGPMLASARAVGRGAEKQGSYPMTGAAQVDETYQNESNIKHAPRTEDGLRSRDTGISLTRLDAHEDVPSLREMETSRERVEKNADIENWLTSTQGF